MLAYRARSYSDELRLVTKHEIHEFRISADHMMQVRFHISSVLLA